MWLIVSCPYLRDKDYIIGECLTTWTQQRDTVLAGEMAIRRFAETGYRIACGIFGSTVMTGNNHTVFKDLAPAFADADGKLYMYCAQAIERCQQIARELGIRASSDPSPHTAVLKRWIAGLTANSDITSASAQSKKNGARTRKQWKVRADQLAKATELLDRFYRLPDGRYMNDPDKLWAPHMPTYSPLDEFSNAYGRTNRGRPLASELAMHNANVAASGFGSRLAVVEQESAASEKKQKKQKKQKNQNQKGKPQTPVAEEVTTTSASAASAAAATSAAAAATSAAAAAAAADVTTAAAAAATAARFNVGVASPPRKRVAKKAPAQKRSSGSEDTVSRGRKSARGGDCPPCRHVKLHTGVHDTENHQYKQMGWVASADRGLGLQQPPWLARARNPRERAGETSQARTPPPYWHACAAAGGKAGGCLTAKGPYLPIRLTARAHRASWLACGVLRRGRGGTCAVR
jgi:hypothetical protein